MVGGILSVGDPLQQSRVDTSVAGVADGEDGDIHVGIGQDSLGRVVGGVPACNGEVIPVGEIGGTVRGFEVGVSYRGLVGCAVAGAVAPVILWRDLLQVVQITAALRRFQVAAAVDWLGRVDEVHVAARVLHPVFRRIAVVGGAG